MAAGTCPHVRDGGHIPADSYTALFNRSTAEEKTGLDYRAFKRRSRDLLFYKWFFDGC